MSVGIGSKSLLAYIIESTYGVFPSGTPAGTNIGILSESIQSTRNSFASQEINPTRQMTTVRSGNVAAAGELQMEFSPNVLGMFLKHLLCATAYSPTTITATTISNSLAVVRGDYVKSATNTYLVTRAGTLAADAATTGAPTSTDNNEEVLNGTAYLQFYGVNATALYQHIFNAGVTKPAVGIAVEKQVFLDTGTRYFRYTGGRINTWSLEVPQEGIVRSNFGFLFLDLDSSGNSTMLGTNVAGLDEPFAGSQAVIQVKTFGGSYADDFSISDLRLNLTNNYDERVYTIGQRRRRDLPEGQRVITGSFTALFEDMTKFDYFKNETQLAMKVTFNHLGMFAQVELKKLRFTGGSPTPTISGNGVVTASFNIEAFTDGTNDIVVTLKNSTTTYV